MIHLNCPEETASQRFLSRGQPGDSRENYEERLSLFKSQTVPFIEAKKDIAEKVNVLFYDFLL